MPIGVWIAVSVVARCRRSLSFGYEPGQRELVLDVEFVPRWTSRA
jgi:hypothetical protein